MKNLFFVLVLLSMTALAQKSETLDGLAHIETVQVGPYTMKVGFSKWPLQAEQSLDFLFMPEGGIDDKSGTLTFIYPDGEASDKNDLPRFPRDRSIWGFDIFAISEQGQQGFKFDLDGPQGKGTGTLEFVVLPPPPFLPTALSWTIGLLPFFGIFVVIIATWFRVRPGKRKDVWVWQ